MKTFWKGFTILGAIKDVCDSWEKVKISTLSGVWKKLILTLMDDFERFRTSVEEVNADIVEMAREVESLIETYDITFLFPFHLNYTEEK